MPSSQPFLAPGAVYEYHLEFCLRDGVLNAGLVEALGPLWGPQVTGVADPGLVDVPEMPGASGTTV